jgi:hypothetical protein
LKFVVILNAISLQICRFDDAGEAVDSTLGVPGFRLDGCGGRR